MSVVACADGCVVGVPSHVKHNVVKREVIFVIAADDVEEFIGGIVPVAAIPDTVYVFAGHRHLAADSAKA